jgi:hypothetical protein
LLILDNMSRAARPVSPNAVVWYSPGMFSTLHSRISCGEVVARRSLIAASSSSLGWNGRGVGKVGTDDGDVNAARSVAEIGVVVMEEVAKAEEAIVPFRRSCACRGQLSEKKNLQIQGRRVGLEMLSSHQSKREKRDGCTEDSKKDTKVTVLEREETGN